MKITFFVIYITICIIELSQRVHATNCDEKCKCEFEKRPNPENRSAYVIMKTVDCDAAMLKLFIVKLPIDAQVIKANENQLSDFNDFTRRISALHQLREIEISDNKISNFNATSVCPGVTSFDASDNNVSVLTDRLFIAFPNLKYLTLRRNAILDIDRSLCPSGETKLRELILSYNQIDNLSWLKNCRRLKQLRYLDVSGNKPMRPILQDHLFSGLSKLKSLIAEEMQIRTIEANAFSNLQSLEVLDLDNNQLDAIPSAAIAHTPNLATLSLNGNYITRIEPNALHNLAKLQLVELSSLPYLQVVDKQSFNGLPSLETLLLFKSRRLSYIDGDTFLGCVNLRTLDVHDTMIETILDETITSLPSLKNLNFKNNPVNCNSLMQWATQWTNKYNYKRDESSSFTCARPPKYRGTSLDEVDLKSQQPEVPAMQPTFPFHITISPNSKLILNCRAFGYPKPAIKWILPNGVQVNETKKCNTAFIDGCGTLTVTKIVYGAYKCIAMNQHGVAIREVLVSATQLREKEINAIPGVKKNTVNTSLNITNHLKSEPNIEVTLSPTKATLSTVSKIQIKSTNRIKTTKSKNKINAEFRKTILPIIKMDVPKLYFLDVSSTSALITWSSKSLNNSFQINYNQKLKISLEHQGRILYDSIVQPFWVMPNQQVTTSKYNISSLEPGQKYKVCISLECCVPKRKKQTCSFITTPSSKHASTQTLSTFSTIACIIIAMALPAIALYFGRQCYITTNLNKSEYEKVDEERPLQEIFQPLLQETMNGAKPPELIRTTATTSFI